MRLLLLWVGIAQAPQQEEVDISPPAPLSTSSMPSAASDQSLVTLALRLPVEATNVEVRDEIPVCSYQCVTLVE